MNVIRARFPSTATTRALVLDSLLAAGLAAVAVTAAFLTPAMLGQLGSAQAAALGLVTAAPIALRRRWPIAVLVVVAIGILVESAGGLSLNFSGFALMLAVFTVAAESPRRVSLAVLALLPIYLIAADLLYSTARSGTPTTTLVDLTAGLFVFVLAWVAGDAVRARRLRIERIEERATRLEAEQAEAASIAVRTERALIARELHDIVAHNVSVMVIQAGAARRVMAERPDEAREALESIEATGRQALTEMRRLLGILRTDEMSAPLQPQEGLARLGELIAQAGSTGMQVELAIDGEPRPLSPGLDLAAFRIVQEALTNAIKHASGTHATVRLKYDDALTIEVVDDGRSPDEATAREAADSAVGPGAGHGLVGMRERVSLYGGEFTAGPRPAGGFAIRARLPFEAPSR